MAYERRGGRFYYYRKTRVGGRVRSEYIGPAGIDRTNLFAGLDQIDRERRQHEARARGLMRSELTDLAADPEELALMLAAARIAVAAALEAAGYHQHKRGEWRKKRGKKDEAE